MALGASISLSTILGIPSLKAIHGVLDLCHKKIFFNQLNLTLSMVMTEPHDCFPPLQHANLYSTLLFSSDGSVNRLHQLADKKVVGQSQKVTTSAWMGKNHQLPACHYKTQSKDPYNNKLYQQQQRITDVSVHDTTPSILNIDTYFRQTIRS